MNAFWVKTISKDNGRIYQISVAFKAMIGEKRKGSTQSNSNIVISFTFHEKVSAVDEREGAHLAGSFAGRADRDG